MPSLKNIEGHNYLLQPWFEESVISNNFTTVIRLTPLQVHGIQNYFWACSQPKQIAIVFNDDLSPLQLHFLIDYKFFAQTDYFAQKLLKFEVDVLMFWCGNSRLENIDVSLLWFYPCKDSLDWLVELAALKSCDGLTCTILPFCSPLSFVILTAGIRCFFMCFLTS